MLKQAERVNSTLLYLFVQFRPSIGWIMPVYTEEGKPFHSVHQFKYYSILECLQETFSQIFPEIMSNQISGQSSWHMKLIIRDIIIHAIKCLVQNSSGHILFSNTWESSDPHICAHICATEFRECLKRIFVLLEMVLWFLWCKGWAWLGQRPSFHLFCVKLWCLLRHIGLMIATFLVLARKCDLKSMAT